jgi:transcriptional regulator
MYVPAHFAAHDMANIAAFVDQAGSADLVTFDGKRLISTLLPVIWDRNDAGNGRLIGHIALTNPQWQDTVRDVPALAIFHGPQAYISPSWYQSTKEHGRTVPTWNYTTVHMSGPVMFHRDDDWLRNVVTMQQIEAKDKLSQNRTPQDRAGVITALRSEPSGGARAIAELMASREPGTASGSIPAGG